MTKILTIRDFYISAQRYFLTQTQVLAQWKISSNSSILINPAYPSQVAGLQVIDYYLWAMQRLYEREEDQFFQPLAKKYRLIMDLDDKRNKPYGEWYHDRNPLTLEKLRGARTE